MANERERLKSIELDIEKGIFKINGKDYPLHNTTDLSIVCNGGFVEIETSQHFSTYINGEE